MGTTDERTTPHAPETGDDAGELSKSYLVIRIAVGLLGIALPTVLWLGETWVNGSINFRGSLSSYYHSSMRDVFVGTLWAIGVLLIAYRAWNPWSRGFWLSCGAGVGAILLAFFPTARPGDPKTSCETDPPATDCAAMQTILHEDVSQRLHFTFTALFIVSAAGLCLYLMLWARERGYTGMATIQGICLGVMILAVAWIFIGPNLGSGGHTLKPLYIGELLAVYAFAAAWLSEIGVLWRLISRSAAGQPPLPGDLDRAKAA